MKTVLLADNTNPLFMRELTVVFTSPWKIFRAGLCPGPFLFGRLNVVVLQMAGYLNVVVLQMAGRLNVVVLQMARASA